MNVTDTQRLDWVLPLIGGEDNEMIQKRMLALKEALALGKKGRDSADYAMEKTRPVVQMMCMACAAKFQSDTMHFCATPK